MFGDQLSEAFDLVEVRGQMSGAFTVRGPWVARSAVESPLKLIAMVHGHACLSTDGLDAPLELNSGDVAILNNRSWLYVEGGTGDGPPQEIVPPEGYSSFGVNENEYDEADVVVGGHVELNTAGQAVLLQALPPVGHVRASAAAAANLRGILDRLVDEVAADRIGSAFAIRQYGQLLALDVLRAYIDQYELPSGWLRVLTDERLHPAVSRMHADPGKPWGLAELARAAAMSRTSFVERFRTVAGMPPLTYLNRWRMLLAQRALRDGDIRVGSLAVELGYASESAFSAAFKREVGESPLHYRHRTRGVPLAHADPVSV